MGGVGDRESNEAVGCNVTFVFVLHFIHYFSSNITTPWGGRVGGVSRVKRVEQQRKLQ